MNTKTAPDLPLLSRADNIAWDSFPGTSGKADELRWKTFAGGTGTSTTGGVSFGICQIPCGDGVSPHHHAQVEYYYVVEGCGTVQLGRDTTPVSPGSIIYVPGDVVHGIRNTGTELLVVWWIIPANRFSDVDYEMI